MRLISFTFVIFFSIQGSFAKKQCVNLFNESQNGTKSRALETINFKNPQIVFSNNIQERINHLKQVFRQNKVNPRSPVGNVMYKHLNKVEALVAKGTVNQIDYIFLTHKLLLIYDLIDYHHLSSPKIEFGYPKVKLISLRFFDKFLEDITANKVYDLGPLTKLLEGNPDLDFKLITRPGPFNQKQILEIYLAGYDITEWSDQQIKMPSANYKRSDFNLHDVGHVYNSVLQRLKYKKYFNLKTREKLKKSYEEFIQKIDPDKAENLALGLFESFRENYELYGVLSQIIKDNVNVVKDDAYYLKKAQQALLLTGNKKSMQFHFHIFESDMTLSSDKIQDQLNKITKILADFLRYYDTRLH